MKTTIVQDAVEKEEIAALYLNANAVTFLNRLHVPMGVISSLILFLFSMLAFIQIWATANLK